MPFLRTITTLALNKKALSYDWHEIHFRLSTSLEKQSCSPVIILTSKIYKISLEFLQIPNSKNFHIAAIKILKWVCKLFTAFTQHLKTVIKHWLCCLLPPLLTDPYAVITQFVTSVHATPFIIDGWHFCAFKTSMSFVKPPPSSSS